MRLYKFVHGTSTEQVVDKGIRQKSTKEWTHSLTAVPFVRGHRSVFPWTPRNTGVYTRHPTFVTATSGVLTRLPAKLSKKRNACLHAVRQAVGKKFACLNGLRSEGVKKTTQKLNKYKILRQAVKKKFACLNGLRSEGVKKTTQKLNKYKILTLPFANIIGSVRLLETTFLLAFQRNYLRHNLTCNKITCDSTLVVSTICMCPLFYHCINLPYIFVFVCPFFWQCAAPLIFETLAQSPDKHSPECPLRVVITWWPLSITFKTVIWPA